MGSEEVFNQFTRLEEKIETLINKCVVLDKENFELKNKISDLKNLIKSKEESEAEKTREAEDLKLKIDNIIEKISNFNAQGVS